MDEADQLADRIVVIARGRIVADDTPAGVKSRAAGRRVRFRTTNPLGPGDLAGLPVTAVSIDAGAVTFLSGTPEVALAELFRRELVIEELEVGGADLEEAFLTLTGSSAPPASMPPAGREVER
jgi:ABC-2 type transport system ATP-binding protein